MFRGITTFGHSSDGLVPSSFTPAVGLSNPASVVFSNASRSIPVQLNVQGMLWNSTTIVHHFITTLGFTQIESRQLSLSFVVTKNWLFIATFIYFLKLAQAQSILYLPKWPFSFHLFFWS